MRKFTFTEVVLSSGTKPMRCPRVGQKTSVHVPHLPLVCPSRTRCMALVHTMAVELIRRDAMQGDGGEKQRGIETALTHGFTKQRQHKKHDGLCTVSFQLNAALLF